MFRTIATRQLSSWFLFLDGPIVALAVVLSPFQARVSAVTLDWWGGISFDDPFAWTTDFLSPALTIPGPADTARFAVNVMSTGPVSVINSPTVGAVVIDPGFGGSGLVVNQFFMDPGSHLLLTGMASQASLEVYNVAEFSAGQITASQGVVVGLSPPPLDSRLELRDGAQLSAPHTTIAPNSAARRNQLFVFDSTADLGVATVGGELLSSDSTLTTTSLTSDAALPASVDVLASSRWTGSGTTAIGNQMTGSLDVTGGSVAMLDQLDIGVAATAVADVFVANQGFGENRTELNASAIRAGIGSSDTDLVINFGARASAPLVTAGIEAGSIGRIELSGRQTVLVGGQSMELPATLEATTELVLGQAGTAELRVDADSLLSAHQVRMAVDPGSSSLVRVRSGGTGAGFRTTGHVEVAGKGTAHMNITDGGEADVASLAIGVSRIDVDHRANGNVLVSDAGSQLTVQGAMVAGDHGDSQLTVTQSGVVTAGALIAAERRAGPLGETTSVINVNNGGTLSVATRFDFGKRGKAELNVAISATGAIAKELSRLHHPRRETGRRGGWNDLPGTAWPMGLRDFGVPCV